MPWPPAADLLAPLAPWFDRVRRRLPWRAEVLDGPHPDPYAVLVSELMLQQTQVATVVPYFERWMARFPTAQALAAADDDAIHRAWEGLGYYRRARFLQAAAACVAAEGWPSDLEGLSALPGLGPYTAAAVGAIAFQQPTPALDGNAFRVLARLLLLAEDPRDRAAELRRWLAPALEACGPSRMTQALMELGATICLPTPDCPACPLADRCGASRAGRTGAIPPPRKRARSRDVALWLLAFEADGRVLLRAPTARGLLAGLWRWPAFEVVEDRSGGPVRGLLEVRTWPGWTQVYTHRRELVNPLHVRLADCFAPAEDLRWLPLAASRELPMGKRDRRLRDLLESPGQAPLETPALAALIRGLSG